MKFEQAEFVDSKQKQNSKEIRELLKQFMETEDVQVVRVINWEDQYSNSNSLCGAIRTHAQQMYGDRIEVRKRGEHVFVAKDQCNALNCGN